MNPLFCPCTPKATFDRCELTQGLLAKRCPSCSAVLLALDDYRQWRDRHFPEISAAEPAAIPGQEEHSKVRVCPSCQHIMGRYRTGSAYTVALPQRERGDYGLPASTTSVGKGGVSGALSRMASAASVLLAAAISFSFAKSGIINSLSISRWGGGKAGLLIVLSVVYSKPGHYQGEKRCLQP
ncbi:MAG: hypothetical protein LBU53_00835 [Zoogloeaceae bacterium]|jgi:hypothetical protein|nr:hypothetical protein [Zoogloeaceae bacterium]